MLSNKPIAALSQAERQLLRYQRLRSGQCIRCFHASARKRAEEPSPSIAAQSPEKGSDGNKARNQPSRGPSRHQRAAMVSEEVRMLSRDVPSLEPSKPQSNNLSTEGAAEANGPGASSGRMGENNSSGREGPQAQGVGRSVRSLDDAIDEPSGERSTRTLDGALEEPSQGGVSVLGQTNMKEAKPAEAKSPEATEIVPRRVDQEKQSVAGASEVTSTTTSAAPAAPRVADEDLSLKPIAASKEQYLHAGSNTSTIAAANYLGVVKDRIRMSSDPGGIPGQRSIPELAHRFARKKIVQFQDKKELGAVESHLRQHYRGSQALNKAELRQADKGNEVRKFRSLPKNVRNHMVDSVVKGLYDSDGLLDGTPKHKQPVLNDIAKMTMINGTYLGSDGDRLLKKVQSLLPTTTARPQRPGAKSQSAKQ